jgi:hypothetical protein
MKKFTIIRTALALMFLVFTAQGAAALNCPARVGSSSAVHLYETEYYVNATTDICRSITWSVDPSNDGHIISGGGSSVTVQFVENGLSYTSASRSLVCSGAVSSSDFGTSVRNRFNATGFSTSCTLSYIDPNGQTVSHTFNHAGILDGVIYVGSTSEF